MRGVRLEDKEKVVEMVRPQWTVVLPAVFAVTAVPALLIAPWGVLGGLIRPVIVVASLVGVILFGLGVLIWRKDRLVVTNQRLIHSTGMLGHRVREIPLSDVADSSTHQDLAERLVGAGSLRVDVASGEPEILTHIGDPSRIQCVIAEEVEKHQREIYDSTDLGKYEHNSEVVDQIDRLFSLQKCGALTDVEYERAKAHLLREISQL